MSSTPNNHPDQGPRPGSEKTGRELVKNLQAIEADYSKAFEDILAVNKQFAWYYSASLRLQEIERALATRQECLHRLEDDLASLPDEDRAWDNSKNRKLEIKAQLEKVQAEVLHLQKQKQDLSLRLEYGESLYASSHPHRRGDGGTLLNHCAKVVDGIRKSEEKLDKYSSFAENLNQRFIVRETLVRENFSKHQLASAEEILDACHRIGEIAMGELKSHARSAERELAIPLPTARLLSPNTSRKESRQKIRDGILCPQPRRRSSSLLNQVLSVGQTSNSLSKSIPTSAGTSRKHMIYSQL